MKYVTRAVRYIEAAQYDEKHIGEFINWWLTCKGSHSHTLTVARGEEEVALTIYEDSGKSIKVCNGDYVVATSGNYFRVESGERFEAEYKPASKEG